MTIAPFTTAISLTGFLLSVLGLWFYYNPPKNINTAAGYRTPASMRNQQTWDSANKYSSRIMLIVGGILLALGITSLFSQFLKTLHVLVGMVLIVVAALSIILLTERHLNRTFDAKGNKRIQQD